MLLRCSLAPSRQEAELLQPFRDLPCLVGPTRLAIDLLEVCKGLYEIGGVHARHPARQTRSDFRGFPQRLPSFAHPLHVAVQNTHIVQDSGELCAMVTTR